MKVVFLSLSEKFAITVKDGEVKCWTDGESADGEKKIFEKNGKKVILRHDRFLWIPSFNSSIKDHEYCVSAEFWFGEFPYGSWAVGVRQCKATKAVKIFQFETEINPRGLTGQDRFRSECQTFVPDSVAADFAVSGKPIDSVFAVAA